jgi:hypothetical protein
MKLTQEQADELADTGSVEVDGETIEVQPDLVTQFESDWEAAWKNTDKSYFNLFDYKIEKHTFDDGVNVIVAEGRQLWRELLDQLDARGWVVDEFAGTGRVKFERKTTAPTAKEVVEQIQNEYGSGYAHVSHTGPDEKNPYVSYISEIEIPDGWKQYKETCHLVRDN